MDRDEKEALESIIKCVEDISIKLRRIDANIESIQTRLRSLEHNGRFVVPAQNIPLYVAPFPHYQYEVTCDASKETS